MRLNLHSADLHLRASLPKAREDRRIDRYPAQSVATHRYSDGTPLPAGLQNQPVTSWSWSGTGQPDVEYRVTVRMAYRRDK